MSKKDKSKFRKQIKAQLNQEMSQVGSAPKAVNNSSVLVTGNQAKSSITTSTTQENIGEINLPQIRYDLKKTGVVVTVLALITVGFYFADSKYGILLNFGDWLFKSLNIN